MGILDQDRFQMQEGLLPTRARTEAGITIIGLGGIGSFLGVALAKMGFEKLCFIDFDTVAPDRHNSVNSLYGPTHVNMLKTRALAGMIKVTVGDVTDKMTVIPIKIDKALTETFQWDMVKSFLDGCIVVSAVDNMEFRNFFGSLLKEGKVKPDWYIDTRMGAETFVMYTLKGSDPGTFEGYIKYNLFPDSEGVQEPCTERSILYTPFVAAGLAARQIRRIVTGKKVTSTLTVTLSDGLNILGAQSEST